MTGLIKGMIAWRLQDAFDRYAVSNVPEALIMMLTDPASGQFHWRRMRKEYKRQLLAWVARNASAAEVSFFLSCTKPRAGYVLTNEVPAVISERAG